MVSERDKKAKQLKQQAKDKKFGKTAKGGDDNANGAPQEGSVVAQIENEQREQEKKAMLDDGGRTCTGVLTSRPTSRDIKISGFSMSIKGNELITDCSIELTIGRRYGLIGINGCGKTNFLQALANREVPIPKHMDIYHLRTEAEPEAKTALEAVIDHIKLEMDRLQKMEEEIMAECGPEDERLMQIYDRLDELDPTTFEPRAASLLHGLGFSKQQMEKHTKDMSGGWRMRVSLARALFAQPTLLLLDEPTNHLDLEACVWLEEYLKEYKKCLIIISHSQDFLNGVTTHTIWLTHSKLTYYTGNYDSFVKQVKENEVIQQKKYEKEQEERKHIKDFIASCGTYANLVRQAKSKQKILDKMEAEGLTPPVKKEKSFQFSFPDCEKLAPPVMPFVNVSFSYSGKPEDYLYRNLDLGVDCDSRIALVGPNGAGKSTLLKLMTGDLEPTEGTVGRHSHLCIARYHQHSMEILDPSKTVLEWFQTTYPNDPVTGFNKDTDSWRAFLGRFGVSGKMQTSPIHQLSDGQKSRIIFATMCLKKPNMLLLDEPTNHLDLEAIDSLADAIKRFNGGMVLVSHDFRLIDQVANEIWVCDHGKVERWPGSIRDYKDMMKRNMGLI